jgi:hypothetical protein
MPRRFAQDTIVAIQKSRGEIQNILTQWGAEGIRWTDDLKGDQVILEFTWGTGGFEFMARFHIELPQEEDLHADAIDGRTKKLNKNKLKKLMAQRGKREHRVLLLFLKGAFEAIEEGIMTPEQLFLPHLVGKDGRTVTEAISRQLPVLLTNGATALLPPGIRGDDE